MEGAPAIMTVTGPIAPEALGFCHCHEHLAIAAGHPSAVNPALCIDKPELTLRELDDFRRAGGDALVDAQPVGCGREAETLAELSRLSGVHIVASTGFHKMRFYPGEHWIFRMDEAALTRLFVEELTSGMYADGDGGLPARKTPHRAGVIKCAFEEAGLTPQYAKLFAAAASAAAATGAPMMVHIDKDSRPLELADFFASTLCRGGRVAFCHLDRSHDDLAVHRQLAERGLYLEYDTIGREKYHSDAHESELIADMLGHGYAENILLGLDVTRERLKSYGGGVGLAYILESFLPTLADHGVSERDIVRLTRENPARFLAVRSSSGQ